MHEMAWYVEMQPLRSGESRLPTGEVWHIRDQASTRRQPFSALPEQRQWITDVFQHMEHDDEIELGVRRKRLDRRCDNLYSEGAASRLRYRFVALNSEHSPTSPAKRDKHQTGAAT